jgi:anti-sigma B factor antagonist
VAVTTLDVTLGHAGEGTPLLSLRGELDLSTVPKVEQALRQLETDGTPVVILDLRGLTFLDSSGLRLILDADTRARRDDRRLLVVPGPPEVQRVFQVTLTDARIEFVKDPASIEATEEGPGG